METAAFLKQVPVFQGLAQDSAERLAAETLDKQYSAGTLIVRRGTPGDCMYLLVEGKVQVPVFDQEGRQLFVAQLGPKQIFGEMALLTGEARSADVIAVTDCRCVVFPRDAVDRLIRQHADVAQFLTAILGERLVRSGTIRHVGKYRLLSEAGRGGMSIVYDGLHPSLDRAVAIKMLSHRVAYRPRFRARFQNEARIISRLRHPNIVEVYDTEEAYATFFIIMERLSGKPLDFLFEAGKRFTFPQIRNVIRQVASALQFAHNHDIVHRDIRPSNIVLSPEGVVKLTDFGLALEIGSDRGELDEELPVSGLPAYMAPEQITGEAVDARTDIYSLGIVAYEMLTGKPPFRGSLHEIRGQQRDAPVPSPRAQDPRVPDDLEEFVRRATAKAPDQRLQACDEILRLLTVEQERQTGPLGLAVKTLTFIYQPSLEATVEHMIDEVQDRAEDIEGLEVR
ncbi:MAG: protein kinase [bacterium]|nr:protein kinase [bacterium]